MAMEKKGYRDMIELLANTNPGKAALTVEEVARSVGVCELTVRRAIRDRKLKALRAGRKIILPITAVAAWLVG